MALSTGHGNGAGVPRIEVLPADELPIGVQAQEQEPSTSERTATGMWRKGARTVQSNGGKSRARQTRLARRLGLADIGSLEAFKPYKRAAADFRRTHVIALARSIGGGHCGAGPASIVSTAAWQLAASRYLFDLAGQIGAPDLFIQASRLASDSRQNLLAAHELCAKEAQSRPASGGLFPFDVHRSGDRIVIRDRHGVERIHHSPDGSHGRRGDQRWSA